MPNRKRGFTLVELLVVIAIVGLLAGMTIFLLMGARAKARDGKRANDISNLKLALTLYYNDHNEAYPTCLTADTGTCPADWNCGNYNICYSDSGQADWLPGLGNYLETIPTDPGDYNFLFISFLAEPGHFCGADSAETCFAEFRSDIGADSLPFSEFLLCYYQERHAEMDNAYLVVSDPDLYCTGFF